MRTSLFWDITQCTVVISSRRFGTTYMSHIQVSKMFFLTPEDGTDRLSRNISKKLPLLTA